MKIQVLFLATVLILSQTQYAEVFKLHQTIRPLNIGIPHEETKRCTSYPFVSGDTFRAFADFIIDETQNPFDTNNLIDGDIIFVNGDFLDYFFEKIHPKITKKYILITHNNLTVVPGKFAPYLKDATLVAWFGKNAENIHHKMRNIPLGIANTYWPHGNINVIRQAASHQKIIKDKLLYLNIDTKTNPERSEITKIFAGKSYCYLSERKPFDEYLLDLAESFFVLSPEGAGIDSVRTWEALLMGSFPIVKHSIIDPLFDGLPIVLIDDWQEINEQFLQLKYSELSSSQFMHEKLYANYWLNLISLEQHQIRHNTDKIPTNFGVSFDYSMEQTNAYRRTITSKNKSWQLAKSLYRHYVIENLDYSEEPRIPKIIHQIWLGSEFPEKYKEYRKSWLQLHPTWQYKLWTNADIAQLDLVNKDLYEQAPNYGEKSDIARYEILYRFGGLYIDTDFLCLKPFDIFHHCFDFYAGCPHHNGFIILNGLIGCAPDSAIIKECIKRLQNQKITGTTAIDTMSKTGPHFITSCFAKIAPSYNERAVIFPMTYFYPWPWTYRDQPLDEQSKIWIRPESFAIHCWDVSWNNGIKP